MTALLPQIQAISRGPHVPRLLPKQDCWESQLLFCFAGIYTHSALRYLVLETLSQYSGAESSDSGEEGKTHLERLQMGRDCVVGRASEEEE
jgi:hypothetical protein